MHPIEENASHMRTSSTLRALHLPATRYSGLGVFDFHEGSIPFTRSIDNQGLTKKCSNWALVSRG
jgi:hypothetical protein